MDHTLGALRIHVGPKAYSDTMAAMNLRTGDLKPEGGASVEFYTRLRALPPEEIAPFTPLWSDQSSMIAAFRAERDRIGMPEFERILNSKPGFMFDDTAHNNPVAVEIYRAMQAVQVAPVVADVPQGKTRRLF